jgi:hypothetical protein
VVNQPGADVVAGPKVRAGGVCLAGARGLPALLVLVGRVAQLVVTEPGAGEVGLLAGDRRVGGVDLLVDAVEHEHRVDDPKMPAANFSRAHARTRRGRVQA